MKNLFYAVFACLLLAPPSYAQERTGTKNGKAKRVSAADVDAIHEKLDAILIRLESFEKRIARLGEMEDGKVIVTGSSSVIEIVPKAKGYLDLSEEERQLVRQRFRSLAQKQLLTIEFYKSDGTLRVMKCTLDREQIPAAKRPSNKNNEGIDSKLLQTVFDVETGDWRSFRFDRLKQVAIFR
jgi:hypothetical protein